MKTITIDHHDFAFPATWNELTAQQLRFLARISSGGKVPVQDVLLKMALYCLGAKITGFKNNRYTLSVAGKRYGISPEDFVPLADCFDFLLSAPDKEGNRYIDPRLNRNPFPDLKTRYGKLTGPADALTDISYGQFIWLQTFAERMQNDPEAVDSFIGIIYTGRFAAKIIPKLPADIKTVIYWFYIGSLRFIADKYPRVFSGTDSGASDITAFEAQQKIIHSLADYDLIKKDQVRRSLLYDALYTMELNIDRHEKL